MPDFSNIPSISNVQMLALARNEYAKALQAQSLGKGDRHLTRADIDKMLEQIKFWEERVAADNGTGSEGGVVYAGFVPTQ